MGTGDRHVHATMLQLLGGFCLRSGEAVVHLPPSVERLVAIVALAAPAATTRATVRAALWPDVEEAQARANLRTALWRLGRACPDVVAVAGERLLLAPDVVVDVRESPEAGAHATGFELLPGWYDEWLGPERERIRQHRLHTHEAAAHAALADGRTADAIAMALQALAVEPLRESAHRLLIGAHLAEGNVVEALLQFERCTRLLREELGVGPSPALVDLVRGTRPRTRDVAVTA